MIISVASGKGGTGKTTISTNLACALGENVQLLDCDVEEPNAHLFLNPEITSKRTAYAMVPDVDLEKCTGCGSCAEICRYSAITVVGDTVLTFPELCHGCNGCVEVCPENAIREGERELGIVEWGTRGDVDFTHGKMRVGEAMSPPLIKAVRDRIDTEHEVIIDAPPGTSCPVISAMRNTDFVLLVTEPTPFGLHDLQLAVEAVRVLNIPCGIVINRSDLGDSSVQDYAVQEGVPILMEIPFDRSIAEAYSKGQMLIDLKPEWREKFIDLHNEIQTIAASC